MRKLIGRAVLMAAIGGLGLTQAASATLYINKRICGGSTFATCAAVQLDVNSITNTVTLRVWNLAGNTPASSGVSTFAGSIFRGIGIYNVPSSVNAIPPATTSGGSTIGTPSGWILSNNVTQAFLVDFALTSGTPTTGYQNGLASGCASSGQLPASTALYVNPCMDPNGGTLADWLTFTFQVNSAWDATNTQLVIRYGNALTGQTGECWTGPNPNGTPSSANCFVVPEPMSMTLLATGLVGLGGVGFIRRRRSSKKA